MKKIVSEKKLYFFLQTFVEYFRSFRKTDIAVLSKHALYMSTWTFWQNFSHHVRTLSHIFWALVTFYGKIDGNLCFHFRTMSLCFLENFDAKAHAGLEKLQYTCPHNWFHRNYLLWKKNNIKIEFQNLGGIFSCFQKLCQQGRQNCT